MSLLEDEDDDPERGRERQQVQHHRLDRQQDRAERTCEQDQRQDHHECEHVREVPVERVHEVAVDCRNPRERAVRAIERLIRAIHDSLDPGRRPIDCRERLDE